MFGLIVAWFQLMLLSLVALLNVLLLISWAKDPKGGDGKFEIVGNGFAPPTMG